TIVVDNLNTTNGIQIDATGTLQLDVGTLELTGTGAVKLTGGSIKAGTAADILDNDGNQITGFGSITSLTLWNDGTTEALGGTLIRNTGNQVPTGADALATIGILEASSGSTLEIHDNVSNSTTGQTDTNGAPALHDALPTTTIVVDNLNTTNGIQID